MNYSVKQAAKRTNLSEHTIRYYDREGLTPCLKRNKNGERIYLEKDICWLELICCLKSSGMSLNNIKEFMNLCLKGKEGCEERKEILEEHRENILCQIEKLNQSLCIINYKLEHYKEIGIFHIDGE